MREIEFRGRRKSNGKWFYWNLTTEFEYENYIVNEIVLETVGQYVGQKDKNKKKIYEGDIFTTKNTMYKIDFFYGSFGYAPIITHTKKLAELIKKSGHAPFFSFIEYPLKNNKLEIVGNIYELPKKPIW